MCRAFVKNKDTRELIEFAKSLGFLAVPARSGHIKFTRPGCQPIFTSSTPSDHRAWLNAKSNMKRALKNERHVA